MAIREEQKETERVRERESFVREVEKKLGNAIDTGNATISR